MDYNIYIHDKTTSQKPTQPRQSGGNNTTPKTSSSDDSTTKIGAFQKIKNYFSNSGITSNDVALGVYIAALKITYKVTTKILDTIEPFITRETGDYRFNVAYSNIKNGIGLITNPVNAIVSVSNNIHAVDVNNRKKEQERLLIGDSIVNDSVRKV